jgi:hypothetical protein
MTEERLRSIRLRADAGPLRDSVLAAAERARREQRLWRRTWIAAAVVVAIAAPVNLAVDSLGGAIAERSIDRHWPEELSAIARFPVGIRRRSVPIPRSVEEIR